MLALVLADIDDLHWRNGSGKADLVISLGDIADSLILEAAESYGAKAIFAVKGNHDPQTRFAPAIIDLHMKRVRFGDLTFGGFCGSWKYKPKGHWLYEQDEVSSLLTNFPSVDVFVAHNSPQGTHDKTDDVHTGFGAFNRYISQRQPHFFFHGHQHVNQQTNLGMTTVLGVYGHKLMELE